MNNSPKNKPYDEQVRRTTERIAEQSKEAAERATDASVDAAETTGDCYAKALKSFQDYQIRLMELTQTHFIRSFELVQKLVSVKSPTEFIEVSSDHLRRQGEIISEQAKQFLELTQSVSAASVEPLRTGFERTLRRVA
jgi:hypothetical protein